MVLADYFEHVLQLPLAYHSGAHSGRQMKIMLTGTDTLWWLWVSFFREHFAAFVFIVVLLPASLILNWRLALPLLVLCVAFTALTVLVMHKAFALQRAVERHYSDLAETAADALGNVALVQSYARVELEVSALKTLVNSLLRAQMPVLSWWAVAAVLTRAGTTLTMLVILLVRHLPQARRPRLGRRDRQLHEHRRAADHPARAGGQLRQPAVHGRAEACRLLRACSTPCRRCATGRTRSIPAACAAWSSSRTCRFPMTASAPRWRI